MNKTYTLARTEHGQFIILREGRATLQAVRTKLEAEMLLERLTKGQGERHEHREGCRVRYKCGDAEFIGTALHTTVI